MDQYPSLMRGGKETARMLYVGAEGLVYGCNGVDEAAKPLAGLRISRPRQ